MFKNLANLFMSARLYLLAVYPVLYGAGAAMNQAVLIANGDKFPVMINDHRAHNYDTDYIDDLHVRMTEDTKLNWLADFIDLHQYTMSPGDLLLELAVFLSPYLTGAWLALLITAPPRHDF